MEETYDKWSVLSNPLKCGISNQVHSVKLALWSVRKLNTRFIIFSVLSLHHPFLTLHFHSHSSFPSTRQANSWSNHHIRTKYWKSLGTKPFHSHYSFSHSCISGTRFSPLPSWNRPFSLSRLSFLFQLGIHSAVCLLLLENHGERRQKEEDSSIFEQIVSKLLE